MTRGSYIKADYKRSERYDFARPHSFKHHLFRIPLLVPITGIALLGVVFANANGDKHDDSRQNHFQAAIFKPDHSHTTPRITLPLTLPVRTPSAREQDSPPPDPQLQIEPPASSSVGTSTKSTAANRGAWHQITVASGDTLSSIFSRLDIYHELDGVMRLGSETKVLNSIYPGQDLRVRIGEHGMEELIFDPDYATRLSVIKTTEGGLRAELRDRALDKRRIVTSGIISRSLYLDGNEAGLSDLLIMKLAELFGWDIDFALDIREGDAFTVIHEEFYRHGQPVGSGDIVAAEFTNQDRIFRAIRYTDSDGRTGYFTPEGRGVRRPFLRTPVDVARISSHFDLNRRHPILNTIRAHRGVDYAASTGTPIKATGDAVVEDRGYISGYGNTIILRHGSIYTTLYGHMSAFANGTSVGQRVEQGQTIGYIGSTGLATGPHLHYEFRINGVHHNPLTVALPAAEPLPEAEKALFQNATASIQARLDDHIRERIAMK